MATTKEQEKLVLEFCENTGADKEWAYSVLARNKWNMPSSYREIEQMLINSSRGQQTREITQCASHHKSESPTLISQIYFQPSSGEMPKSIGPAVEFDPQEVRAPVSTACRSSTGNFLQGIEGLRVALPPAHTPVERVIPIRMEGRTVSYPQSVSQTSSRSQHHYAATSVHHPIYDEKVIAIQPSKEKTEIINPAIGSENIQTLSSNVKSGSSSESYPKLKRGFSNILENEFLVSDARSSVLHDIQENSHDHMYIQSFVLPNITDFPEDFQAFLEKELIETSTLISLEQAGRLNWWAEIGLCQRLIPLATSGDGNCLLHAASLAMWGIHDRQLILRNALHSMLTKEPLCQNLYRRWRWQQDIVNRQSGLVLSELEWKAEWDNILRLASPSPRGLPNNSRNSVSSCCDSPLTRNIVESEPVVYESLEEFHVFVLAHVLQRPIIVVADTVLKDSSGEDLAPIPFGGIYLPVECNSASCYSSPLLLTYDAAHFSALVPVARSTYDTMHNLPLAIPVVDPSMNLLPLHFSYDPGKEFDWMQPSKQPSEISQTEEHLKLLMQYMDIKQLPFFSDQPCPADLSTVTTIQGIDASHQSDCGNAYTEKVPLIISSKGKERKKDYKPSVVAKQFGSLGKSVGKKLKNIGNNLAPSKATAKGNGGFEECEHGHQQQTVNVGTGLARSTNLITMLATSRGTQDDHLVLCAVLSVCHSEAQEEMVKNYLKDAKKRFDRCCEQKCQMGEELQSKLELYPAAKSGLCANAGFRLHEESGERLSHINVQKCPNLAAQRRQFSYNTFPGRSKGLPPHGGSVADNDKVYLCGKSKFYTPHPQTVSENDDTRGLLTPVHSMNRQQSVSTGNMAFILPRVQSQPLGYDNMQDLSMITSSISRSKCASKDCPFYGSKETLSLCSKCYKQLLHPDALKKSSKV